MTKKAQDNAAQLSPAQQIWEEIRGTNVSLFALPEKKLETMCEVVPSFGDALFLRLRVPALLPELEARLSKHFDVVMGEKYVEVTRKRG